MDIKALFEKAQELRNNGQTEEAVKNYQQIQALCLALIGVSYSQANQFEKALKNLNLAKKEFEELGNMLGLGAVLRDLGSISLKQRNLDEAEVFFQESIQKLEQTSAKGHLGMSQVKLGLVFAEQGDLEKAEKQIKDGISEISQSQDKFFESTGYFNLAQIQIKLNKAKDVRLSLSESLEILNQLGDKNQFQERRKEISQILNSLD